MPKYRVIINEEVQENRTYEIEAADAKEAARIAANEYLVNDKLPKKKEVFVNDRWYDVLAEQEVKDAKRPLLLPAWQFNTSDIEGDGIDE